MELFIPSLLILVLSYVFFIILPKMAPYTVGFLALALFAIGIWQNYKMFPYEYKSTMFIQTLRDYSPFVLLIVIILGGMTVIHSSYGQSPPSIATVIPEVIPANIMNVNKRNTNVKEPSMFNLSGNTNTANGVNAVKRNNMNKANIASTSFKTV